jgi:hypothetical protein
MTSLSLADSFGGAKQRADEDKKQVKLTFVRDITVLFVAAAVLLVLLMI